ncbi:hypothetical protein KDH_44760 [Dictyobacter sp. S3.2.2.5]|uniref:Uncharacterized protein n=1 Tax=Dictyobacter halimunensis TaxID=3026934 RepID=A0ABQ6FXA3_9CHLR|nr:hypothetical protein KDH_44760 [Dictyobacter sp. S3.2.2.5]
MGDGFKGGFEDGVGAGVGGISFVIGPTSFVTIPSIDVSGMDREIVLAAFRFSDTVSTADTDM